ncbi:L-threonine 3-O-phosphate decarboxylase [Klebsiella michiganensis]|uniref:L-threonine 3-O-phosphate decarboxylase n=1 Tax=Klebsiella michiganensis TaxID=1134687 RepID=A0A7H4M6X8_9ENTR|nr:L-threonine 3-O-phosphate decarboxylase [Klebsiella michiganensis]
MALLKSAHGGNIREAAALLGISAEQLLDFSANINPLGMPESLKRAHPRQYGLRRTLP